ncbi:MAG: hypothetical protein ACJAW4_000530 [Paracoccaceae bacterium]|jgi:hypothetical protein
MSVGRGVFRHIVAMDMQEQQPDIPLMVRGEAIVGIRDFSERIIVDEYIYYFD